MEMTAMADAIRWLETMFQAFAQIAGPAFVAALWQGAALAAGLAICLRLFPRIAAADRFRAWGAGFAALLALPFLPFLVALLRDQTASASLPASGGGGAAGAWFDLDPHWTLAIAAVWILVALVRVADLVMHSFRLRALWKQAVPVAASVAEPGFARPALPASLNSRPGAQPAELCTTRELDRPSVIGFFRPRILIPEWLFEKLTPAELEQVILHEAEHLRRRDDWTNLLQKLALVLFPLNPALAWIERLLCREREMACDEAVVRATEEPRSYAACLTSLAELGLKRTASRRAEALSLGAWRRRPELVERVHRILRPGPGLHPATARALLGLVGCGLLFGSVELSRCPRVVAFAAPVQPELAAAQDGPADALETSYAADRMAGYRAMNATIRVPDSVNRRAGAATHLSRRSSAAAVPGDRSTGANEVAGRMRAVETVAGTARRTIRQSGIGPEDSTATAGVELRGTELPRQWVVFTAWEQVQTVQPAVGSAQPEGASAAGPQANAHNAGSALNRPITVTRMVLIYRAAPPQAGAARSHASSQAPLFTGLPAAVPLRDGWLVLQL